MMNNQLQVFSKEWFNNPKTQRKLLWLLNHSRYFRSDMGIQRHDLPFKEKIVRITPNSFTWRTGEREFMTDFRTHNKFGKRLYYGFLPVWKIAHEFDMRIANRFVPALNVGFDTLTVYPQAGFGGTTCDGLVARAGVNENWATIRAGAGTAAYNTLHQIGWQNTVAGNAFQSLYRFIATFDTSSLTSLATISAATKSLYGNSATYFNPDGNSPKANIYLATPASSGTLVAADYSQIGATKQCDTDITYASWNNSGYNDFALNAAGIGNISKTGITRFGCREVTYDVGGTSPAASTPSANTAMGIIGSDAGSNIPKLVITYTLPAVATGNFFMLFD